MFLKHNTSEKLVCSFVRLIKCCDQSGDRVSKNDKRYYICSILVFNIDLLKVWKIMESVCLYWIRFFLRHFIFEQKVISGRHFTQFFMQLYLQSLDLATGLSIFSDKLNHHHSQLLFSIQNHPLFPPVKSLTLTMKYFF